MIFEFIIRGDRLRTATSSWGHTGNVNSYICTFQFDAEWDGLSKFAAIKTETGYVAPIPITDNQCVIPYEVLKTPGTFSLGVYGTIGSADDFKRISTNWLPFKINNGAYCEGTAPETPEPDVWERYLAEVQTVVQKEMENKADKATTLEGYGITDTYTIDQIDKKFSGYYHDCGSVSALPTTGMKPRDTYNMLTDSNDEVFNIDTSDMTGTFAINFRTTSNRQYIYEVKLPEDVRGRLPAAFTINTVVNGKETSMEVQYGAAPPMNESTPRYWFVATQQFLGCLVYAGASATANWSDTSIPYELKWHTGDNISWTGYQWDNISGYVDLSGFAKTEDVDAKHKQFEADIKFIKENTYTKQESDDRYLPKRTVSGNPVSVSDQLENVPLIGCTIHGASGGVGDLVESGVNIGKYRIGVKAVGKQLFDKDACQWVGGYFAPTANPVAAHAVARTVYIPCSPNTTYTISRSLELEVETDTGMQTVVNANSLYFGYTTEIPDIGVEVYNIKSGNASATSLTLTTGEDAKYLVCFSFNGNYYAGYDVDKVFNAVIATIQIEFGSKATPNEAYTENTVEIFLNAPLGEGQAVVCTDLPIAPQSGVMNVLTDTAVQPSTIDVRYYQDINKVLAAIQAATIALGGM